MIPGYSPLFTKDNKIETPNMYKLYSTPSHHALRLVPIHNWCSFVLTWFIGFPWSRHSPSGYGLPCTMLISHQICFHPLHLFCFKVFYPLIRILLILCMLYTAPISANGFVQACFPLPPEVHYSTLFLDGEITEWSVHTSNPVATCHLIE